MVNPELNSRLILDREIRTIRTKLRDSLFIPIVNFDQLAELAGKRGEAILPNGRTLCDLLSSGVAGHRIVTIKFSLGPWVSMGHRGEVSFSEAALLSQSGSSKLDGLKFRELTALEKKTLAAFFEN